MRLAQLHVPVLDIDRAVGFYRSVLGFDFLFQVDGEPMAFFQAGDVRLYLGVPENPDSAGSPMAYYSVDDLDDACDRIEGKGVELTHQPHLVHRDDAHELWMAGVRDSEGNLVMLMEERPVS